MEGKPPAEDGHLRHWLKRRTGGTPACILPKGLRNPQPLLDTLPDLCSAWPLPHQWWMSMLKTEHTRLLAPGIDTGSSGNRLRSDNRTPRDTLKALGVCPSENTCHGDRFQRMIGDASANGGCPLAPGRETLLRQNR